MANRVHILNNSHRPYSRRFDYGFGLERSCLSSSVHIIGKVVGLFIECRRVRVVNSFAK